MCLDLVQKNLKKPIRKRIGYQIMIPWRLTQSIHFDNYYREQYKKRKDYKTVGKSTLRAKDEPKVIGWAQDYRSGFHVYKDLDDAKRMIADTNEACCVVKVEVHNIWTLGRQNHGDVYVGDRIKVIKEAAISKKLKYYRTKKKVPLLNPSRGKI